MLQNKEHPLRIFLLGWKDKVFFKEIAIIIFPILIANTINTSLQLIDQLMLASLGKTILTAITYVNLIYFFIGIIFFGIGSATSIFFSRLFPQKNIVQINQVKAIGITIGWLFCIVTTLIGELIPEQVLSLYTKDPEIISIGVLFFKNISYGQPFFAVAAIYIYILRIIGRGTEAMLGSILAFVVNTLLNYILIFGHLGFPALGVLGAAIATNIARMSMMIFYFICIMKFAPEFKLTWKDFTTMPIKLFLVVLHSTTFLVLGDALWAITLNLYSSIFGHISIDAAATYAIALMFRQLTIMLPFAITPAVLIIIGRYIGEKNSTYTDIRNISLKCQSIGFVFSVFIGLTLSIVSPLLLNGFYHNIQQSILDNANIMIITLACLLPLMTANNIFGAGIFRAGGDTKINLIFIFLFNFCLSFPLAYFFGTHGYSIILVFLATYSGDCLRFIGYTIHFIRGKWILNLDVKTEKIAV